MSTTTESQMTQVIKENEQIDENIDNTNTNIDVDINAPSVTDVASTTINYQNMNFDLKFNRKNKIQSLSCDLPTVISVHNSLSNMEMNEKLQLLKKVATDDLIDSVLLSYAFNNLKFETIESMVIDTFIQITRALLEKYHPMAGGEYFDDSKWTLYTDEDNAPNDYVLSYGECIFENSISYPYYTNSQTIMFIKNLIRILNQIAKNIKVYEKKIYIKAEHMIIVHLYILDTNILCPNRYKENKVQKY